MIRFRGEISDAGIDLPCINIMGVIDGIMRGGEVSVWRGVGGEIEAEEITLCWAWGTAPSWEYTALESASSIRENRVDISAVKDDMWRSILRSRIPASAP